MEVSVSFTDKQPSEGYIEEKTVLGKVWIPEDGVLLSPPMRIRYEKHPWMEKFEFDGIKAAPAKRTGIGSKGARGFVKSLSTIYSEAYNDYRAFGGDENFDVHGYFRHAADHFAQIAENEGRTKMTVKFCGFAENMWREGDQEMLDVCMSEVMPVIGNCPPLDRLFRENITEEFRSWLAENRTGY